MSEGLVEQLQREALDPSVPVSTLLRKVKVTAVKLQLSDTVDWADSELKGYTGSVPQYRVIYGRSMARDYLGRWLPIGGDDRILEAMRSRALGQSIGSLEAITVSPKQSLTVPYPPQLISKLEMDCIEAALFISKPDITGIIDHVRSLVLDWALDLERAGITGEGLAFTRDEQQTALASHINIQIDGANARVNLGSSDYSINVTD